MRNDPHDPEAWYDFAGADLRRAHRALRDNDLSDCLSRLEQCAEKAIKGKLIGLGWPLERTHNLPKLIGELRSRGVVADWFEPSASILLEGYIGDRYPGASDEEFEESVVRNCLAETERLFAELSGRAPEQK
jgi:HEPN domain-containing protein